MSTMGDLVNFDKDSIRAISYNSRKPEGMISDTSYNSAEGAARLAPHFEFYTKRQMRLTPICELMMFYAAVGRDRLVANIR